MSDSTIVDDKTKGLKIPLYQWYSLLSESVSYIKTQNGVTGVISYNPGGRKTLKYGISPCVPRRENEKNNSADKVFSRRQNMGLTVVLASSQWSSETPFGTRIV